MAWRPGRVLSFDQEFGLGTILDENRNKVFILNYMSEEECVDKCRTKVRNLLGADKCSEFNKIS